MLENEYGIHPSTSSSRKLRTRDSRPINSMSSNVLEQDHGDIWETFESTGKGYGDHDRNVTFEYATFHFISTPTKCIVGLSGPATGFIWTNIKQEDWVSQELQLEGSSLTHFYLRETADPAQVYSEIMQVFFI